MGIKPVEFRPQPTDFVAQKPQKTTSMIFGSGISSYRGFGTVKRFSHHLDSYFPWLPLRRL